MKLKILTGIIAGGCLFGSMAFGQGLQITGTLSEANAQVIKLVCDGEKWTVKQTRSTTVTHGTLKRGAIITVRCKSPNAHKNE